MAFFALLALAVMPSGGQAIGDAAHWLRSGDFPSTEWRKAAVTRYDLMVDEIGHPVSCMVTGPSGSPIIDKVACTSLMERARYASARDAQGQIIPQAIRGRLEWQPDSDAANEFHMSADLAVRTPSVAANLGNVPVKVALIYARTGAIEQCVVIAGNRGSLGKEACAEVSKPGVFAPVRDGHGATTRGLREIEVIFSHGPTRQVTVL